MTDTLTHEDTESVEDLDFAVPCSCRIPPGAACDRPAQWIATKRCGHVGFECAHHRQMFVCLGYKGRWSCMVCFQSWPSYGEAVISVRRL